MRPLINTKPVSSVTPVYYPVFLRLKNKKCVVAGGGRVAERKVLSLLKAGAVITVISPTLTQRLKKEGSGGNIKYIPRGYKKGDLRNAFLRKDLEKLYSPEFGKYLNSLKKLRAKAMIEIKDKKKRGRFLKKLATKEIIKKFRTNS
ncbi:MAG: NAD(P)-dependent oxidoreductase [Nitrospirae bacterium]|nr:NAD(P)-dependent oxidoreductase [Nitrospirota bacterium]